MTSKRAVAPFPSTYRSPSPPQKLSEVLTTDEDLHTLPTEPACKVLNISLATDQNKSRQLWRRAFFRIKVRRALKNVSDEILIYGTSNDLISSDGQYKGNIDEAIEKKVLKLDNFHSNGQETYSSEAYYPWLIHPEGTFKKVWSLVLLVFMLYTATLMPYRIAFEEAVYWDFWTVVDMVLDFVFIIDLVCNFFSITQREDGSVEFHRGKIALLYLKTWFLVDLISCFPMTLVDFCTGASSESSAPSSKYNSLMRLARLPRMYKLLRIVRVMKVMKHLASNSVFERFQDYLQINARKA